EAYAVLQVFHQILPAPDVAAHAWLSVGERRTRGRNDPRAGDPAVSPATSHDKTRATIGRRSRRAARSQVTGPTAKLTEGSRPWPLRRIKARAKYRGDQARA